LALAGCGSGSSDNATTNQTDAEASTDAPYELADEDTATNDAADPAEVEAAEPKPTMDDNFKTSLRIALECTIGAKNYPAWVQSLGAPITPQNELSFSLASDRAAKFENKIQVLLSYAGDSGFIDEAGALAKQYQSEIMQNADPNGDKSKRQNFMLLVVQSVGQKCAV
jgi:hypothetical protein